MTEGRSELHCAGLSSPAHAPGQRLKTCLAYRHDGVRRWPVAAGPPRRTGQDLRADFAHDCVAATGASATGTTDDQQRLGSSTGRARTARVELIAQAIANLGPLTAEQRDQLAVLLPPAPDVGAAAPISQWARDSCVTGRARRGVATALQV